ATPSASPMSSTAPARSSSPTTSKSTIVSTWECRARDPSGCRSAAATRATYPTRMAAAAARIRRARSISATCSTLGSASCPRGRRRRCAPPPDASARPMAKRRKSKAKLAAPSRRPVLVPRHRAPPRVAEALDFTRCERFLLHEARLLDEGKFDDWLALFTPDAWYWVPSEPDQDNPHDTV